VSAYVPPGFRQQVRELFSGCCAYCRTPEDLTVATFEVEHIVPRSAGGETELNNLCLACPTCNRCKADRTTAIEPGTQQDTPLYQPRHEDWSDHFAWNDDATEIVPLTAIGRATVAALRMNRPQLARLRRMWAAMGEHPRELG
jgi:hypothetical protein